MPVSDDEYDQYNPSSHHAGHHMSKAELRKSNKPIMEKKRRARINHCLNELKSLILDAMKKDPARHSKLEKADILEMTVKHLQTVQRQQLAVAVATDPAVLHKFKTGFSECASEVSRYVSRLEGVDSGVRQRLVSHLNQCVSGLQQLSPFSFLSPSTPVVTPTPSFPTPPATSGPAAVPQVPFPAGDVNNNHTRLMQLIPSRLPSGELALVVPNSSSNPANQPFFPPAPSATVTSGAIMDRSHPSAFTAVNRACSPPRPLIATSPGSSTSEESSYGSHSPTPKPSYGSHSSHGSHSPTPKPSYGSHGSQSPPPKPTYGCHSPPPKPSYVSRSPPPKPSYISRSPPPKPSYGSYGSHSPPPKPTRTEVKLELKTVTVPRRMTSSIGTSTSSPPLSSSVEPAGSSRQALDFSMKPPPPRKRPSDEEIPSHIKVPRFSVHVGRPVEPVVPRMAMHGSARHPPAAHDSMWRPW